MPKARRASRSAGRTGNERRSTKAARDLPAATDRTGHADSHASQADGGGLAGATVPYFWPLALRLELAQKRLDMLSKNLAFAETVHGH